MSALLCALMLQDPEALLRDLGSDALEERIEAERGLRRLGPAALPALRAVEGSGERALRARALIADIERLERERLHDLSEKARLRRAARGPRDEEEEKRPGVALAETARFELTARSWMKGRVISTFAVNYLRPKKDFEISRDYEADMDWDVEALDAEGRVLAIERCGVCSPRQVLVPDAAGPLKVRVRARQLWFSRVPVTFEAPKDGEIRRVGDWTIQLAWPRLRAECRRDWPEPVIRRLNSTFEIVWKPGIRPKEGLDFIGGGTGGGGRFSSRRAGWCGCPSGPKPLQEKPKPLLARSLVASPTFLGNINFPPPTLEDVARIVYLFDKPVEDEIDVSVELPAP